MQKSCISVLNDNVGIVQLLQVRHVIIIQNSKLFYNKVSQSLYNKLSIQMTLSLSTVVLNRECMECVFFACLKTHLTIGFSQK